jgi:MFS family permease
VIKAVALGARASVRLGLRENVAQFTLLVIVNAFVGAMVGMERSILPAIAEQEFHLVARTAVLSFIVVFGVTKALTNYAAGRLADRVGRKQVFVAGALLTGWIAARHGLRPDPFYPGVVFVAVGLALSALTVRETHAPDGGLFYWRRDGGTTSLLRDLPMALSSGGTDRVR